MTTLTLAPQGGGSAEVLVRLSPRERQVARLLVRGSSAKAIAERLHLRAGTIEKHIQSMSQQLYLAGRIELMIWLLQNPCVLAGKHAPGKLHKPGCDCPAIYCSALRQGAEPEEEAA